MENDICPVCGQPQSEKWKRVQERIKRAAEKAARTGNRKDLRTYLRYRRELPIVKAFGNKSESS